MKKIIAIAFVAVFVIANAVISFAQDSSKTDKPVMGMSKGMMGKAKIGHGMMAMCPNHGMMMGKGGMVASQDGGVIVMTGNKLYKYDKDLNLIKEAEVKMDMEGMQKMMTEMKKTCPMCHEMMEQCGMMMGKEKEETKEPTKATKP
jgi:hypothetical protein